MSVPTTLCTRRCTSFPACSCGVLRDGLLEDALAEALGSASDFDDNLPVTQPWMLASEHLPVASLAAHG